jgi:hypothetical protein
MAVAIAFTLSEVIAAIACLNRQVAYDVLFRATAEMLSAITPDPKYLVAGPASSNIKVLLRRGAAVRRKVA